MKTPYLIKNSLGQYWLASDGIFTKYPFGDANAAGDCLGIEPMLIGIELQRAMNIDQSAYMICTDSGPCLETGFKYFDGRYNKLATVLCSTEDFIWAELEGGRIEEFSKRFFDHHMQDRVYKCNR